MKQGKLICNSVSNESSAFNYRLHTLVESVWQPSPPPPLLFDYTLLYNEQALFDIDYSVWCLYVQRRTSAQGRGRATSGCPPDGRCHQTLLRVTKCRTSIDTRITLKTTMSLMCGGEMRSWGIRGGRHSPVLMWNTDQLAGHILVVLECTFWQCPNISVSIETIVGTNFQALPKRCVIEAVCVCVCVTFFVDICELMRFVYCVLFLSFVSWI